MNKYIKQTSLCFAGLAFMALAPIRVFAESEPGDNTPSGASILNLGSNGDPVIGSGNVDNSDSDYYRITNSAGYSNIVVTFTFSGSSPDTCRLRVLGPNSDVTEIFNQVTDNNTFSRSFTINSPAKGAFYFIGCLGNSADGNKPYTLTVDPSPNIDLLEQIEETEDLIANLIRGNEMGAKGFQKLKAKLKVAKGAKKKGIKKALKKNKQRKRTRLIEIILLEIELEDLESQLE